MKSTQGMVNAKDAVDLFTTLQEADPDIAQLLTSIGGNYILAQVTDASDEIRLNCLYVALGQIEVLKRGLLKRLEDVLEEEAPTDG